MASLGRSGSFRSNCRGTGTVAQSEAWLRKRAHLSKSSSKILQATDRAKPAIPTHFWSVSEAPYAEDGTEQIYFRGAVLVHASRRREEAALNLAAAPAPAVPEQEESSPTVSPEIAAALQQPQTEPHVELSRLLKADGVLTPACIALRFWRPVSES